MTSLLTGFLLARTLSGGARTLCRHDVFRLVGGTGLGLGLSSCSYFLGLLFHLPWLLPELLLLTAVCFAAARHSKSARCPFCASPREPETNVSLTVALAATLSGLTILAAVVFLKGASLNKHGGWDAWAIWNLRARFLFHNAGAAWKDGFTPLLDWSHPDYPLLVPGAIADIWKMLGHETTAVPVILAAFFTFGTVLFTTGAVGILRGRRQGLLAGIALAAVPALYVHGTTQYADVPLGFFLLASLAWMALADRFDSSRLAALSGVSAGMAGWTKNEGLDWFICFLLARLLVSRVRRLPAFLAGAAPVLATIAIFKTRVAIASDVFGSAGRVGMTQRLMDASRYKLIAEQLIRHGLDFGPLLVSPFLLLAVYLLVTGVRRDNPDSAMLRTGTLGLALTGIGYCMIYVLRTLDLGWLIATSMDRLIEQLWPGVVFCTFLAARTSEPVNSEFNRLTQPEQSAILNTGPKVS